MYDVGEFIGSKVTAVPSALLFDHSTGVPTPVIEIDEFTQIQKSDGSVYNVIDIITVVNIIVGSINPNSYESCAADTNGDQIINVIDIIAIVNTIISS